MSNIRDFLTGGFERNNIKKGLNEVGGEQPEYVFNGASDFISVTSIDSTHVVVAYRDDGNSNYGTAIVGTISSGDTITFGSEVVFNSANSYYNSVTSLDSTHVVVAYTDGGNSSFGAAIVGTISSGDTIAFGTAVVFNSANSYFISVTTLDSTHVVVAYRDVRNSSFGTAIVGIISSGDTIGFGSEVIFNRADLSYSSVTALDSTHVVITYRDEGNSNYGTAIVGIISGTTISFGSEYVFNSADSYYNSVTSLDSTHVVIVYEDDGNSNYGIAVVGTISGTTISFGSEYVFNSADSYYTSVTTLDSTHVVVVYKDVGNLNYGTAIVGTISSGDTITFGTAVVFNSGDSDYISVTTLDSTHVVVVYKDVENSSFGTGIIIEVSDGFTYSKIGRALSSTQIFLDSTDFVLQNI